jgi:hypothetical protein
VKRRGKEIFAPEWGGGYEAWERRPLDEALRRVLHLVHTGPRTTAFARRASFLKDGLSNSSLSAHPSLVSIPTRLDAFQLHP